MTRKEYLTALAEALHFMGEKERDEVLSFYDETIEDRMETGTSEEQAVASLETPAQAAAKFRAENPASAQEEEQPEGVQRKTLSCPAAALRKARLRAENVDVTLRACPGDQATLTYYTSRQEQSTARFENGELTLDYQRGGVMNFFGWRSWRVLLGQEPAPRIELAVPADCAFDLFVRDSNAAIQAEGLCALGEVELSTSNGKLRLENIQARKLTLSTSNSKLLLSDVQTEQGLRAVTSNAHAQAERVRAGEDAVISTSNARLTAQAVAAGHRLSLTTSNGKIEVGSLAAQEISLATSNAVICGVLPGRQADWAIDSRTSNGSSSLPKFQAGAKPLSVHTSNASIRLEFEA